MVCLKREYFHRPAIVWFAKIVSIFIYQTIVWFTKKVSIFIGQTIVWFAKKVMVRAFRP